MTVYNDYHDFREAVRDAYTDSWDEIFNYCGVSPKTKRQGNYTYYDASHLCHKEKTPSIEKFAKSLYCHGCKEQHDIFSVCTHITGKDFNTVLRELGEIKGITLELKRENNKKEENKTEERLNFRSPEVQKIYALFMTIAHHFLFKAVNGEDYRDYLKGRSLDLNFLENLSFNVSKSTKIRGVGCIPLGNNVSSEVKKTMLSLLKNIPNNDIDTMEKLEKLLSIAKLTNEKGNFKLMGRVIFTIVLQGKVVNLYGRKIDESNDYPKHMYLELENHGFYNFDDARKLEYAVFAECIIDAVSLMQFGINAISTFGVGGWKPEICIKMIKSACKLKMLYLCYDKDKVSIINSMDEYKPSESMIKYLGPAGMKSAIKVSRDITRQTDIKVRIVDIPYDIVDGIESKNDVNNMIIKLTPSKSQEEIKGYFDSLLYQAQDADVCELLMKLEILTKNNKFYNDQDMADIIIHSLSNMHVLNAHRVVDLVSKQYRLPFELLFRYQMFLNKH